MLDRLLPYSQITVGTTALMVYEYFITLDDEVELIWK
jgi:Family of unknown function (DUF6533)